MDWPLVRFLLVIACLVASGVGLGYAIVTNPDWQMTEEQKAPIKLTKRN